MHSGSEFALLSAKKNGLLYFAVYSFKPVSEMTHNLSNELNPTQSLTIMLKTVGGLYNMQDNHK